MMHDVTDARTFVKPHMRESLAGHTLVEIPAGEKLRMFVMQRPGTSQYKEWIIFAPFGIVLAGDVRFGRLASLTSNSGYGLTWFAGRLSEDYLMEKFGLEASHGEARSHAAEMRQCAAGWLVALQRRFAVLYEGLSARTGA